jgi:hypothetical protein
VGFLFQPPDMKKPSLTSLQLRKEQFEERLKEYELDNPISDIASFDQTQHSYIDHTEAAQRLLVLLAVAFTAYNFNQSEKVMDWLKKEQLWKSVSDKEKEFFRHPDPSDEDKQNLSWRFEGAYMLAWSLNKVHSAPAPESECTEQQVNEFLKHVPAVGSATEGFFSALRYRPLAEILDEALFYSIAEEYFRDLVIEDKENTSPVHAKACNERHLVLSWLINPGEKTTWDSLSNHNDLKKGRNSN